MTRISRRSFAKIPLAAGCASLIPSLVTKALASPGATYTNFASLGGVPLLVGRAVRRRPRPRARQTARADSLRPVRGIGRQVLDPAAKSEPDRVQIQVSGAEPDQAVTLLGD